MSYAFETFKTPFKISLSLVATGCISLFITIKLKDSRYRGELLLIAIYENITKDTNQILLSIIFSLN